MRIELGIWDHFERRPQIEVSRQYQEKIELVRRAETEGVSYYHVAEHHLSPLDMAPSPSVFLAALAQATSTIRIGTGVYCLPLYHPVRLVQELCMLDNISNGRLDVGVGRGIRAAEHDWFGVSQSEAQPRFEEVLDILIKTMSSGRLGHRGEYYDLDDAPLDILPVQRPYPPVWYAGGAEFAGTHCLNYLSRSVEDIQRYWRLWQEHSQEEPRINAHLTTPRIAITRHVVVRETYEEAEAIARRSWPVFEGHWFATPVRVNEEGHVVALTENNRGEDFDEALKSGRRLIVGTPETVAKRLNEWKSQLSDLPGFDFTPAVQWGDITLDEASETVQLLSRQVLPAVQD